MMEPDRDQLAELARIIAETAPQEIDCDTVLDRVAAYLETAERGERLPEELRAVAQHLEVCPECKQEFEALLKARDQG